MKITKIRLNNIRSYVDQEINFPIGPLLLSGDVGSGKSSILLAIDFALFGSRRSTLSGSSLLRNGTKNGYVELYLDIDGNNIIIKRTLKREANIVQDSGFITINNVKKEASPLELKQIILDLLNYPKELLMKSKSLIYRYTVYTPQEEMKQILLGDRELRTDTLRKVFGIDKYKRIKENSKIFASKLRERKKELSGMISDLDDKISNKKNYELNLKVLTKEIDKLMPRLNELKLSIKEKKVYIKDIAAKVDKLKELKKGLELNNIKLENSVNKKNEIDEALLNIEKQIDILKKEVTTNIDLKNILKLIKEEEANIIDVENELKEINNKINEYKILEGNSNKIKKSISDLEICFVCKQKVSKEHKHNLIEDENKKLEDYSKNLKLYKEKLLHIKNLFEKSKDELNKLNEEKNKIEFNKIKLKHLDEKINDKNRLLELKDKTKKEVGKLNLDKKVLEKEISKFKDLEKKYNEEEILLNDLLDKEKDLELNITSIKTKITDLREIIENIEEEINNKLKIKNNLKYLDQIDDFLEQNFTKILDNIEKQVMLKVYFDFNEFFKKWFNILVDEETLNVKLDEEFTPVIEQNGHNIDYLYLSGGEKTAIALAYRLALNQVINSLVSTIKTNDIIILDEPTDGFSDEQLDRIKLILDELKIGQIVIVSHEAKIESFVDNVIRLKKENHVSRIIY